MIPMERQSGQTAVQKFIPIFLMEMETQTGTFAFDEDGHMLSGWQDVELSSGSTVTYYFGDENEGWAATGWQYLEMPDTSEDDSEGPEEDEAWFYFGNQWPCRKRTDQVY